MRFETVSLKVFEININCLIVIELFTQQQAETDKAKCLNLVSYRTHLVSLLHRVLRVRANNCEFVFKDSKNRF